MPKNILQDIKPLSKRSASVKITTEHESRSSRHRREEDEERVEAEQPEEYITMNDNYSRPPRRNKSMLWILTAAALLILFFALSYVFGGATVDITPKTAEATLADTFTAVKNGDDTELSFEVMSLSDSASKDFVGEEKEGVEKRATGKVIIYNEFSTAAQPLLIETRLSTKDGKIYKTDVATTVPGYTTKSGEIVPGSVEVGVHADATGPDYNIGPSDFNIVGFKGTSKYGKFYARGKGDISGGASGTAIVLATGNDEELRSTMATALKDKLLKQASNQIPPGYIYFDGGTFVTLDGAPTSTSGTDKNITVTQKGTLTLVLFNEEKLVSKIADAIIPSYDGNEVKFSDISKLVFELKDKSVVVPDSTSKIDFTLTGKGIFTWQVEKSKLLDSLKGTKKRDVQTILSEYPSIDSAEVTIVPFWKTTLPKDPDDINLVIKE